ncbi:hypothetical protein ACFLWC_06840 [Chloroflexota bacterium]
MMYEVVWPSSKKVVEGVHFAKRLDTLKGKTVGFLWNGIFHGDKMFPVIEKELAKRYPNIKFVEHGEFGLTYAEKEADVLNNLPDSLKKNKCDAIISGIGC